MTPAEESLVESLEDQYVEDGSVEQPVVRHGNMLYITFHEGVTPGGHDGKTFRIVVEEVM